MRGFEVSSPGARLDAGADRDLDRRLGARGDACSTRSCPTRRADLRAAAQRLRAGRGARARVDVPGARRLRHRPWSCSLRRFLPSDVVLARSRVPDHLLPRAAGLRARAVRGLELLQRRASFARGRDSSRPGRPSSSRGASRRSRFSRRRAARVGRDAGCAAPPGSPAGLPAASPARVLALPRLRDRGRPAPPRARAAAAPRRRLLRALALLAAGAVASLLKGFDWEEAIAALGDGWRRSLPCRRFFYRRSSLFRQPFSPVWTARVLFVLVGTGFLLALSYRHVEYSHQLWWQFELESNASRSLRALVGGLGVAGVRSARGAAAAAAHQSHAGRARRARARAADRRGRALAPARTSRCSATSRCSSTRTARRS